MILIGLAGVFGLYRLFQTTDTFAKIILALQIIAIGITFIKGQTYMITGLSLYALTLALVMVYGLTKKEFQLNKKLWIALPVLFALLTHLFQLLHLPGARIFGFTMIIPLVAFILFIRFQWKNIRNELGFLFIISTDALVEILRRLF
jgi:hypothetical protein